MAKKLDSGYLAQPADSSGDGLYFYIAITRKSPRVGVARLGGVACCVDAALLDAAP